MTVEKGYCATEFTLELILDAWHPHLKLFTLLAAIILYDKMRLMHCCTIL